MSAPHGGVAELGRLRSPPLNKHIPFVDSRKAATHFPCTEQLIRCCCPATANVISRSRFGVHLAEVQSRAMSVSSLSGNDRRC